MTFIRHTVPSYSKCSKISNTSHFCFTNKMLIIMTGIHKMLVRIANSEKPGQTASGRSCFFGSSLILLLWKQSDLGMRCLSRPFLAGIYSSVQNLRTFYLNILLYAYVRLISVY